MVGYAEVGLRLLLALQQWLKHLTMGFENHTNVVFVVCRAAVFELNHLNHKEARALIAQRQQDIEAGTLGDRIDVLQT